MVNYERPDRSNLKDEPHERAVEASMSLITSHGADNADVLFGYVVEQFPV